MRLLLVALLGCGAQSTPQTVTVTMPSSTTRTPPSPEQPFIDAGCTRAQDALDCSKSNIRGIDACRFGLRVLDVKLDPPAPVAECYVDPVKVRHALHPSRCGLGVIVFAATQTGIVRITSPKDLAAAFAPVTTPDEAIAFAQLETGDDRMKDLGQTDYGKPMQTVPIANGSAWRFDRFHYPGCGCEHSIDTMTYLVERDGAVTLVARAPARVNADMSGTCMDY